LANDVSLESRYRYEDSLPETRSEVALPLKIDDRVLGVLDVQSNQVNDFSQTDMLVLRALADNIAIAVEDTRLYGDLRRRAEQLSAVAEVSRAAASILDLNTLLREVVTRIHQRFGYSLVQIFTVHVDRGQIIYRAGSGHMTPQLQEYELAYGLNDPKGIIPSVAREGKTALVNDVRQEPTYRPSKFLPNTTRAELAVPLVIGTEVLGVLDVHCDRQDAFGDEDRSMFEALADNVAIALRNANLYRSEHWRRQVADSLREVAGLLSSEAALDQVLEAVLAELDRTLPCDVAAIWLRHADKLDLAAVHGCPVDEVIRAIRLLAEDSSWLTQALHADQPTIRTPESHFEPLGTALEFPPDYSAIAAPLRAGDRQLGVLALAHHAPDRYGRESQAMTAAFASHAAVAIENTRLFEAAQEQAWVSTVLLQVAEATQSLTSLDEIIQTVVRLVPMLVGAKRCALLLSLETDRIWDQADAAKICIPAASYGLNPTQKAAFDQWIITPEDVPAFDHLRLTKAPIVIDDPSNDPRLPPQVASEMGFESALLMPLLTRGDVSGALLVDYRTDQSQLSNERLAMMRDARHRPPNSHRHRKRAITRSTPRRGLRVGGLASGSSGGGQLQ
jgi:GAF domain-containing protein